MRKSGKDYYGGGYSGSKDASQIGPPHQHGGTDAPECTTCTVRGGSASHNERMAALRVDTYSVTAPPLREFDGGATRDTDTGKYDYEGALSPAVLREFAGYMHKHRHLPDGTTRGSDNWQAGMPRSVYMQSLIRHIFDLWLIHRGEDATRPEDGSVVSVDDALGGILFNVQGYWLETLKERA